MPNPLQPEIRERFHKHFHDNCWKDGEYDKEAVLMFFEPIIAEAEERGLRAGILTFEEGRAAGRKEVIEEMQKFVTHFPVLEDKRPTMKDTLLKKVGFLRQWLNEDRITDPANMVTNEELLRWLENATDQEDSPTNAEIDIAVKLLEDSQ